MSLVDFDLIRHNGLSVGTSLGACYCNKPWFGVVPPPPCDPAVCWMTRGYRTGTSSPYAPASAPISTPTSTPQGWVCPRCNIVNSPAKSTCGGCCRIE